MALSNKAKKRLEVAMARAQEAKEVADAIDKRVAVHAFADSSSSTATLPTTVFTILDFNNVVIDPLNTITTGSSWKFTAPMDGNYRVSSQLRVAGNQWVTNNALVMALFINNGVNPYAYIGMWNSPADGNGYAYGCVAGSCIVPLKKGDQIDIRGYQDTGGDLTPDILSNTTLFISIDLVS
jgi:hypothetical protein